MTDYNSGTSLIQEKNTRKMALNQELGLRLDKSYVKTFHGSHKLNFDQLLDAHLTQN